MRKAGLKDFTWHDLRHTFASRRVMAGVDLRTVAELLGHKRIQMTMRYAHLAPQHKLAAVEKLASFNQPTRGRQPVILEPALAKNELTPELTPAQTIGLPVNSGKVQ